MWFKILATKYRDQLIFANITRRSESELKLLKTLKVKSEDQSMIYWRKKTKDKTEMSDGQLEKYSDELNFMALDKVLSDQKLDYYSDIGYKPEHVYQNFDSITRERLISIRKSILE